MTSITKQVWRMLEEDPSIRKDLARGIINVSALAVYLKETRSLTASDDAVVSAIRRYKGDANVADEHEQLRKALSDAVVSTKTRVTALHLKNSSNLYKYLSDLMKDPEFYKSEIFRLIKSRNETICIIDKESLGRVKGFFPEGNIDEIDAGLGELSLSLTEEGWRSKGILAAVTNELANHSISIHNVITARPKLSLFIRESDLAKAHAAVLAITRG